MVCPPSRGLASLDRQLVSQILSPRSCLPDLVSQLVSQLVSHLVFLLVSVCWTVCRPSPLSPIVSLFVSFWWMACFFRGLVSFVSQPVSQLVSQLVSPLVSQLLSLLVSLCWMVCPHSQGLVCLVSNLSPILSPLLSPSLSFFLFSFVGRRVLLPRALSPLFPSLSPSLCLFLFPFVAWQVMLWKYRTHTCSVKLLARFEAVGSGVENDVIFHFHPPMFSLHPI